MKEWFGEVKWHKDDLENALECCDYISCRSDRSIAVEIRQTGRAQSLCKLARDYRVVSSRLRVLPRGCLLCGVDDLLYVVCADAGADGIIAYASSFFQKG